MGRKIYNKVGEHMNDVIYRLPADAGQKVYCVDEEEECLVEGYILEWQISSKQIKCLVDCGKKGVWHYYIEDFDEIIFLEKEGAEEYLQSVIEGDYPLF